MPSTTPHTCFCYTVAVPTPSLARYVRRGYKIEAGDCAWQHTRHPPMPDGFVILEAATADWVTIWIAEFALEHLLPSPEPVLYGPGWDQNPRPFRPGTFTFPPAPPNHALQRTAGACLSFLARLFSRRR